jgi:hypothetical protein
MGVNGLLRDQGKRCATSGRKLMKFLPSAFLQVARHSPVPVVGVGASYDRRRSYNIRPQKWRTNLREFFRPDPVAW